MFLLPLPHLTSSILVPLPFLSSSLLLPLPHLASSILIPLPFLCSLLLLQLSSAQVLDASSTPSPQHLARSSPSSPSLEDQEPRLYPPAAFLTTGFVNVSVPSLRKTNNLRKSGCEGVLSQSSESPSPVIELFLYVVAPRKHVCVIGFTCCQANPPQLQPNN